MVPERQESIAINQGRGAAGRHGEKKAREFTSPQTAGRDGTSGGWSEAFENSEPTPQCHTSSNKTKRPDPPSPTGDRVFKCSTMGDLSFKPLQHVTNP